MHLKHAKVQSSILGLWFGLARQLRRICVDYIIGRYTVGKGGGGLNKSWKQMRQ